MEIFFAPRDTQKYPPCGMFSAGHMIALCITLALVAVGVYLCRNFTKSNLRVATRIVAVSVTILEGVKIGYNFAYGYTQPDMWLPLAFCSLFIYATFMAGFGRGIFKRLGEAFLACGCLTAGLAFLLFPTTSLQLHPILHYLCFYSMLFHGLMVWLSILYIAKGELAFDKRLFTEFFAMVMSFGFLALIVNAVFDCNMMFLSEPFHMPIAFLNTLHEKSGTLYTLFVLCAYLACYIPSFAVYKLMQAHGAHDENEFLQSQEENEAQGALETAATQTNGRTT